MSESDEPVEIPITNELDLHTFQPRDLARLFDAYFSACRDRGIHSIRLIHGKGSGALRASCISLLRKDPRVASWRSADENSGGWGAMWVELKK